MVPGQREKADDDLRGENLYTTKKRYSWRNSERKASKEPLKGGIWVQEERSSGRGGRGFLGTPVRTVHRSLLGPWAAMKCKREVRSGGPSGLTRYNAGLCPTQSTCFLLPL